MNWAFVDYENVSTLERVDIANYQKLFVLCGPRNKSIKFDSIPNNGICAIELIAITTKGRNNLDFHLAYHLGRQHECADPAVVFHIISNDTDYDGLILHVNNMGRVCLRLESQPATKPRKRAVGTPPVAPATKTAKRGRAAKADTGKTPSTAEGHPDVMPPASKNVAANKRATTSKSAAAGKGPAAAKGRSRQAKPASLPALSEAAGKLLHQLQQLDESKRPQKKSPLLRWIKSQLPRLHLNPAPAPEAILTEWEASEQVTLSGTAVKFAVKAK